MGTANGGLFDSGKWRKTPRSNQKFREGTSTTYQKKTPAGNSGSRVFGICPPIDHDSSSPWEPPTELTFG